MSARGSARSHGSVAAASKARRSAAVMPACVGGMSTRMIWRSMLFISGAKIDFRSIFTGIANDPHGKEVSWEPLTKR